VCSQYKLDPHVRIKPTSTGVTAMKTGPTLFRSVACLALLFSAQALWAEDEIPLAAASAAPAVTVTVYDTGEAFQNYRTLFVGEARIGDAATSPHKNPTF
jgi:hypothetical protein